MPGIGAIVLAAGRGDRMGADKALLTLGTETAIERVVRTCREGGVEEIVLVRAEGAADVPVATDSTVSTVHVPGGGEMLDSIRAGLASLDERRAVLVFPVDYAMVGPSVVQTLVDALEAGAEIALPLFADRPGHPIGLSRSVYPEVRSAPASLRDVVSADASRIHTIPVDDPWTRRDLDTPADLLAAQQFLHDNPPIA